MNTTRFLTAASAARPGLVHAVVGVTQNKYGNRIFRAACGASLNTPRHSIPQIPRVTCPKCEAKS